MVLLWSSYVQNIHYRGDCSGCVVFSRPLFLQLCTAWSQALPLVGQVRILGELEQRNTVVGGCVPAQCSNTTLPRKPLLTFSLVGLHIYSTTSHTVHCPGEEITHVRWAIFEEQRAYSLRILTHANFPGSVFTYLDYVMQWIKIHTSTLSPVSLHASIKWL